MFIPVLLLLLRGARAQEPVLEEYPRPESWLVRPEDLISTNVSLLHGIVTDILVGTPPQKLRCLIDSGSADLWIPSRLCRSCDTKHHFSADKSSTFAPRIVSTPAGPRPRPVKITYGSGQVLGYDVQDTLQLGPFQVRNQSFVIVEEARLPRGRSWDGICGLGWRQLAHVEKPLYASLQELGHKAVFSLVPKTHAEESHMVVGEVPEDAIRPGTLAWAPTDAFHFGGGAGGHRYSFWVPSGGLAVRKRSPTPARFLVDTGTNQVLLVPPRLYDSFMSSLFPKDTFHRLCWSEARAENLVVCDCSITQEPRLPPLRVFLGDRVFPLPISEMFVKARAGPASRPQTVCILQIQPNPLAGLRSSGLGGLWGDILRGGHGPRLAGMPPVGGGGGRPFGAPPTEPDQLEGLLRGLSNVPAGVPGGGLAGQASAERTWSREVKADGSVCTTVVEYQGGRLVKNTTTCTPPTSAPARQLRPSPPGGMPSRNPMENTWVLGGIFLERYVTIFDFDNARIGFAEPANKVAPVPALPSAVAAMHLHLPGLEETFHQLRGGLAGLIIGAAAFLSLGAYAWKAQRGRPAVSTSSARSLEASPNTFELPTLEASA